MDYRNYKCVTTSAMLRNRDEPVTAAVGTTVAAVTVPTDRGDLVGFDLLPLSNTFADLIDITWELESNGVTILEQTNILFFSTFYQDKESFIPVIIPGGSRFTSTFVNGGNQMDIVVKTFFNGNQQDGGPGPLYQR